MLVSQLDAENYFVARCDDYGGPMPHGCVAADPPPLPWEKIWPRWTGKAFEMAPDHRERRVEEGFDPALVQAATEYWLPAPHPEGDTWQSPARKMTERGPLPEGAVTERPAKPEPTLEERLSTIDAETSAAILGGFEYTVDGEPLHFPYDSFDQQNFADTANACLLSLQGIPGLPDSVTWNAYRPEPEGKKTLVRLTLTATDFLALYTAGALAHKATQMEAGGQRKAALEAAAGA